MSAWGNRRRRAPNSNEATGPICTLLSGSLPRVPAAPIPISQRGRGGCCKACCMDLVDSRLPITESCRGRASCPKAGSPSPSRGWGPTVEPIESRANSVCFPRLVGKGLLMPLVCSRGFWVAVVLAVTCCAREAAADGGYVVGNFGIAAQISASGGAIDAHIKVNPPRLGTWLE